MRNPLGLFANMGLVRLWTQIRDNEIITLPEGEDCTEYGLTTVSTGRTCYKKGCRLIRTTPAEGKTHTLDALNACIRAFILKVLEDDTSPYSEVSYHVYSCTKCRADMIAPFDIKERK